MAKSNFIKDFRAFIERGSAVDMAVGIIVGGVMTSVVNSLVKDIIMPPIGLLIGGVDFSQLFIVLAGGNGEHFNTVAAAQAAGATTMNIGVFINSIISFLITMFAVFLIVRVVGKMRSKKPVTTRACPYCKSSISKQACKCPNCCSDIEPEEIAAVEDSDLKKGLQDLTKFATGGVASGVKLATGGVAKIKNINKGVVRKLKK